MKIMTYVFMTLVLVASAYAQDFASVAKEKVDDFDFMIGTWQGEGWMMTPSGKQTSSVTEIIAYDLGNTIITMKGKGVKNLESGEELVVHEALGVLSYDVFQKKYKLQSYIAKGMQTTSEVSLNDDGTVTWWIDAGPRKMRYTIRFEEGKWNEIGEMSTDGENWKPFFEMNLAKVN